VRHPAFLYDPFGRRIQKASAAGTTNYLYPGANTAEELDGGGIPVTKYTQSLSIDEPLAMRSSGAYFFQSDGLGSITSLSDSSGSLPSSLGYGAFGNQTYLSGPVVPSSRYTARDWNATTGLYYFRARYYDPLIGRFLSEDPLRFAAGRNFYVYSLNNPALLSDPTGLSVTCTYSQGSHTIICIDDGTGTTVVDDPDAYSGHGPGLNNPSMQNVPDIGPIPTGTYDIGGPKPDNPPTGPLSLRLYPTDDTNTFNRNGFLIHGDKVKGPRNSASHGCIVTTKKSRQAINDNGGGTLHVVP